MENEEYTQSKTEKKIARKVFDSAYEKEISQIAKEVSGRIDEYKYLKDLWELHDYITYKRKETDYKYDYRYSVLIFVFANLLKDRYISKIDLFGLSESKIQVIEERAKILEQINANG